MKLTDLMVVVSIFLFKIDPLHICRGANRECHTAKFWQ